MYYCCTARFKIPVKSHKKKKKKKKNCRQSCTLQWNIYIINEPPESANKVNIKSACASTNLNSSCRISSRSRGGIPAPPIYTMFLLRTKDTVAQSQKTCSWRLKKAEILFHLRPMGSRVWS